MDTLGVALVHNRSTNKATFVNVDNCKSTADAPIFYSGYSGADTSSFFLFLQSDSVFEDAVEIVKFDHEQQAWLPYSHFSSEELNDQIAGVCTWKERVQARLTLSLPKGIFKIEHNAVNILDENMESLTQHLLVEDGRIGCDFRRGSTSLGDSLLCSVFHECFPVSRVSLMEDSRNAKLRTLEHRILENRLLFSLKAIDDDCAIEAHIAAHSASVGCEILHFWKSADVSIEDRLIIDQPDIEMHSVETNAEVYITIPL